MDYWPLVTLTNHAHWDDFIKATMSQRHILLDVQGSTPYQHFAFQAKDVIIAGRESDGFPSSVRTATSHSVHIPMRTNARSLNVAMATSIVLGEALRQTRLSI